jgi:hypothetical protein
MKQKALDTWMEEFTTQDSWKVVPIIPSTSITSIAKRFSGVVTLIWYQDFAANQLQRLNDVNERRNTDGGATKAHESQGHSEDEDFHGSSPKEDMLG